MRLAKLDVAVLCIPYSRFEIAHLRLYIHTLHLTFYVLQCLYTCVMFEGAAAAATTGGVAAAAGAARGAAARIGAQQQQQEADIMRGLYII